MMRAEDVTVIVPIRNAMAYAERQLNGLQNQTLRPTVIVIDSQSIDGSPDLYRNAGCHVISIAVHEFDHGATRNMGLRHCTSDLVIYLTQDAIPYKANALEQLCVPFADPSVGVVYGRQIPRTESGAIERHGRHFNYTSTSEWREWPRDHALGYRAMFCSNAFAAYRRTALEHIGGFPEHIIQGEDQIAAARALLARWIVVYAGDAEVEHSHGYSLLAEFRRYFDIGVCDRINQSLFAPFGTANSAGRRFVVSEIRYLLRHAPYRIPEAEVRTFLKLLGYHLGQRHTMLPLLVKRHLAMNPMFYARVLCADGAGSLSRGE
jgi:rhamnosyltransferase